MTDKPPHADRASVPRRTARPRTPSLAGDVAGSGPSSSSASSGRTRDTRYLLRLYITGSTPTSARAIEKVRSFCEEHLHDRYDLEVIDIYQLPSLAKDHQIIATPTLIKALPPPLRRFIGDLSKVESVLFGMDIREKP